MFARGCLPIQRIHWTWQAASAGRADHLVDRFNSATCLIEAPNDTRMEIQMLVLQILIIPIVILLLLSTVFIIASLGLEMPRYMPRHDQSTTSLDASSPPSSDDEPSPGIPFVKI